MLFWTIVKIAFKSLLGNKLRSFLTMLGIIIGVGAVIAMMAIGSGAEQAITKNIKAMGSNLLYLRPGAFRRMGVGGGSRENITSKEMQAVLAINGVKMVSPECTKRYQIKYLSQNSNSQVYGTAPTYFEMRNYEIEQGRAFTEEETLSEARVAIMGPELAKTLFINDYPL
ncbi:MAG: ABC transporter permease, partial [Candidatus Wallbacteria bacterium]|nr:ABC transporter permease [Candidatus Wallbacteria bacterium]